MEQRNQCINVFKGIACELVVMNHYYGTGLLGKAEYAISHIGVPFFFLVAGFYLYDQQGELYVKRLYKKICHIFYLLIIHFSLYFIDNCIQKYVIYGNNVTVGSFFYDLREILSVSSLKSMVVWSTSIMGKGQWFLIALIEAYLVFVVLILLQVEESIAENGCAVAAVLFTLHIPARLILIKSGIMTVGDMPLSSAASVRNAWLDALPFMFLGVFIRKRLKISTPKKYLYIGLIATLISVAESFLTIKVMFPQNVSCVLYLGTIVAVASFFIYSVYSPHERKNPFWQYIGDKLSIIIFFIHPLVGFYVSRVNLWDHFILANLLPLVVMIITTGVSYVIYNLYVKIKMLRCTII